MVCSNFCPQLSLITNSSLVKENNDISFNVSNSICFAETACLLLTQYVNKCETKLGSNLVYNIYVINNLKSNIHNVKLKDILPHSVNLICTHVDNGKYVHNKDEIIYTIDIIKPNSFSKITIIVCPTSIGKKINSIEVTCKKANFTINNPSKVCSYVK